MGTGSPLIRSESYRINKIHRINRREAWLSKLLVHPLSSILSIM